MKKKIMNIRPQEVTENGERSVQYKGSDGKMHNVAPGSGGSTAQSVMVVNIKRVDDDLVSNHGYADIVAAIENGIGVIINFSFGTGQLGTFNCDFLYDPTEQIIIVSNSTVDLYIEPNSIRIKE